jgi:hypothetical protein
MTHIVHVHRLFGSWIYAKRCHGHTSEITFSFLYFSLRPYLQLPTCTLSFMVAMAINVGLHPTMTPSLGLLQPLPNCINTSRRSFTTSRVPCRVPCSLLLFRICYDQPIMLMIHHLISLSSLLEPLINPTSRRGSRIEDPQV